MAGIRAPLILSLLIVAGMAALSVWAWTHLPADARIAVHFDMDGKADGYASRAVALGMMPVLAGLLSVLCALLAFAGSRQANRALGQNPLWLAAWLGTVMVLAVVHALIVMLARGVLIDMAGNMNFLLALLWIVLGNFVGKTQPNDYAGVRTRWTRSSDYSWQQCNRIAGWAMVGIGLAMLGAMAAGAERRWVTGGMMAGLLAMAAVCHPLSYYYWRRDPDRDDPGQS